MNEILIILAIGVFAGVASGFIGIGGGLVIVPCLVFFFGMTQHAAQGTSLAMMLFPVGILGVLNYNKSGYVDWKVALILCASFVIGSYFGSKFAISLPASAVKKIFGGVIILVGLKLIFGK